MAKKNKSTAAQAKPVQVQPVEISPEVAEKVSVIKAEATTAFSKGDFNAALSAYDKAINELPKNAVERVDFLVNKAACYILQQKQPEAIKECTAALEIQPDSARALLRRAKAYEAQSETRLALSDYSALNKTEGATDETRSAEKKLREKTIAAALAAAGAARRGPAGRPHSASNAAAAANAAGGANSPITVKVTCDNDTKLIYLPMNGTYADLLALTKAKFPAAGPRMLKYADKDGDFIAITSTQDLLAGFQDVYSVFMKQYGRNAQTAASRMGLPPLRLVFVPVPSEADVPRGELSSSSSAAAASSAASSAAAAEGVKDSWIYDFANLFASVTGLHPDAHVDLHTMGWEAVQKGLDATIHHEEAEGLLLRAADHFRDMACLGLNNLATVHQLLANRFLDNSSKAGKKVDEVADQANVSYDRAQKHFNEALALNSRHFDSVIGLSQLMFERCKVDAGLLVPDVKKPEEEGSGEGEDSTSTSSEEKMAAAVAAAQKDALALLTADRVAKSKTLFTQALELADQAMTIGAEKDEEESKKKKKESGASDDDAAAAAAAAEEEEASLSRQAQVVKGNFLFEWSQMQAAVNDDTWKASLDQSMALFRTAKCPVRDLRTALRNHLKASEIELGPEEVEDERKEAEEKKAAAAAAAQVEEERKKKEEEEEAEKKKKEGVKGLPSLGKGKGKGKK